MIDDTKRANRIFVVDRVYVQFTSQAVLHTGLNVTSVYQIDPLTTCDLPPGATFDVVRKRIKQVVHHGKPTMVAVYTMQHWTVRFRGDDDPVYFTKTDGVLSASEREWTDHIIQLAEDMKHAAENATADVHTEATDNTQATDNALAVSN